MRRFAITAMLALIPVLAMAGTDREEARLLRFPSVGGDRIAFTYAGDLYTVSIDGGEATRLTSGEGFEIFSRFSPDGRTIAFTAQYDGNTEVYTIPAEGGVPHRVTYSSSVVRDNIGDRVGPNNIVMGWTPRTARASSTVPAGMPSPLSADCSSQCLQRAASRFRFPLPRAASAPILPTAPSWP